MATLKITPVVAPVVVERDTSKTEKVYTPDILNGSGGVILRGTAIRIDPGSGSLAVAVANSVENARVIGFLAEDLNAGESGRVIIGGGCDYIQQSGQAAPTPGAVLYLSATEPGKVTATAPNNDGNVRVMLGRAHGTQIFIEIGAGVVRS